MKPEVAGGTAAEGAASYVIESGPPWLLSCRVVDIGRDWLCCIHGGDHHVGAVALAQWLEGEVSCECLSVEHHREAEIAVHAARAISAASGRSAVCIAGIHFDGIDKRDIQEISETAFELATRTAELLG